MDFTKIFQLKGLKPKNKDHTNFYECSDLRKKVYLIRVVHLILVLTSTGCSHLMYFFLLRLSHILYNIIYVNDCLMLIDALVPQAKALYLIRRASFRLGSGLGWCPMFNSFWHYIIFIILESGYIRCTTSFFPRWFITAFL